MFENVVLHDSVVPVGVDANVPVMGESEIHDCGKHPMYLGKAADAMYHMIGSLIIEPLPSEDFDICRLGRRHKGEVPYNPAILHQHIAERGVDIMSYDVLRRISVRPLLEIAV